MRSLSRWEGKVALVTGASSGIGRDVALSLGRQGIRLVLAARREDRLRALVEELDLGADRALVVPTDIRDEASIKALFDAAREDLGGVDILINNAGLGHLAPLLSGSTDHWREMLEVNVLGLCICTREAIADMRRRGGEGHVIHISSMAAHRVPPASGMYSATKYAVRSLTEGLRHEILEANLPIRVTAISPGFVETEFAAGYHKSEAKARETYSRYKVLEPTDIADAVLFVLSAPPHMQVHDILVRPACQPI